MNFNSRILKLSVLIMLVLVLLPAIAAEDSSEAFFIEYSYESDEVVVEDYDTVDAVDLAQEVASLGCGMEDAVDEPVILHESHHNVPIQDQSIEIDDAVIIEEQIESPVVETPDNIDEITDEEETFNLYSEVVSESITVNNNYMDGDVESESTIENVSIIKQGCLFISEEFIDNVNVVLINDLFTETASYETQGFKRSLIKSLELKNNLLTNQDVSFVFAENVMVDLDGSVIICTDKITNDFAFCIDNSVVGDENAIHFVTASFCLNFNPCFVPVFDFESFFDGGNNIYNIYFIIQSDFIKQFYAYEVIT